MEQSTQVIPGPKVNGKKTLVHLLNGTTLASSPLLPLFKNPVNAAYSTAHPPWISALHVRLTDEASLLRSLTTESFTYALFYEEDERDTPGVLATGSARPFHWKPPEEQDPRNATFFWAQDLSADSNYEVWELKLLAVDPTMQKQGLATLLLGLLETEIRRRFEEKKLLDTKAWSTARNSGSSNAVAVRRKLKIVLMTIFEMNGEWYAKRGYKIFDQRSRERGFLGSETGFSIGMMVKVYYF